MAARTLPLQRSGVLPYGVGRTGPRWSLLVLALLAVVGWGLYAYTRQLEAR